jgi:DNA-binding transcriptional LysR family regulator
MLNGVSLDQLRTFVAAADAGSFSAAARKLHRAQSAVSGWVSALETQLGVALFDRTGRYPKLTREGELLLADARNVVANVDLMKARARLMSSGIEPELSVVADVFLPKRVITEAAKAFAKQFPLTPLRLFVDGLGAGYQTVLDGQCSLGILADLPVAFPSLVMERVGDVRLFMLAARDHPLASFGDRRIPRNELSRHVQLVLTDRSELLAGRDFGVHSPSTWRLADLATKHAFLKDGVGYGSMPVHMVRQDIADGHLVVLDVQEMPRAGVNLTISTVHRASSPTGPAAQWFAAYIAARFKPDASGDERG